MNRNTTSRFCLKLSFFDYRKLFISLLGILLLTPKTASSDLLEDLVAWWPLDGNAIDASGNGNDGLVLGPVPCADRFGVANGAMCFDGDPEDFIDIGNGAKPPFPLTVTGWINPELIRNMNIIRNDSFWPYYYGVKVSITDTGQLWFSYGD